MIGFHIFVHVLNTCLYFVLLYVHSVRSATHRQNPDHFSKQTQTVFGWIKRRFLSITVFWSNWFHPFSHFGRYPKHMIKSQEKDAFPFPSSLFITHEIIYSSLFWSCCCRTDSIEKNLITRILSLEEYLFNQHKRREVRIAPFM